jgi:hypothetical protein
VPYRRVAIHEPSGHVEIVWSRVPPEAFLAWLSVRDDLRALGYPDRPPDVDTSTLRLWLPHVGEAALPYLRDVSDAKDSFPVQSIVWSRPDGLTAKVLVMGYGDGSFTSRVSFAGSSGERTLDQTHHIDRDADPSDVGEEIETLVSVIDAYPGGWGPDQPVVTDYCEFVACDAEIALAEAEAIAAGLLARPVVH